MDLVTKVFSDVLEIPPEEVSDSLSYLAFERWDSVSHMKIMTQLEDALGIEFETEDVIAMETVAKVRDTLNKYTSQRPLKQDAPPR